MLELTILAESDSWILVDEDDGEVGRYPSQADALIAAADYAGALGEETPHLLVQTEDGTWDEALVEPPSLH